MDQIYNENAVVKTPEILKTFLYTKFKAKYIMQVHLSNLPNFSCAFRNSRSVHFTLTNYKLCDPGRGRGGAVSVFRTRILNIAAIFVLLLPRPQQLRSLIFLSGTAAASGPWPCYATTTRTTTTTWTPGRAGSSEIPCIPSCCHLQGKSRRVSRREGETEWGSLEIEDRRQR